MESLNTLVGLITCRPLTQEESTKMTEAIIEVRELLAIAIEEKRKQEMRARAEMTMPPWSS
jgi:hypothetical protein